MVIFLCGQYVKCLVCMWAKLTRAGEVLTVCGWPMSFSEAHKAHTKFLPNKVGLILFLWLGFRSSFWVIACWCHTGRLTTKVGLV